MLCHCHFASFALSLSLILSLHIPVGSQLVPLLASLPELLGTLPVIGCDIFTCQLHHIERGKQPLRMEQAINAILLAGILGKGSSQQKTTEIKCCPKVIQVSYFITILFNF